MSATVLTQQQVIDFHEENWQRDNPVGLSDGVACGYCQRCKPDLYFGVWACRLVVAILFRGQDFRA